MHELILAVGLSTWLKLTSKKNCVSMTSTVESKGVNSMDYDRDSAWILGLIIHSYGINMFLESNTMRCEEINELRRAKFSVRHPGKNLFDAIGRVWE